MRTTGLPDPNSANLDLPCAAATYWPSFVAHAVSGPVYFREHWGPLSIKCTIDGAEHYDTCGERYTVRPDNYLILNTGQRYACEIAPHTPSTETFTVFFQPELAESVLATLALPDDLLLDDPDRRWSCPVTFLEGPHHHDALVTPRLRRLKAGAESGHATKTWFDEQFSGLISSMLSQHRGVVERIESLPFKKVSTRVEIFRRLLRARDYIDAYCRQDLSLASLAREACMAPHHFLRSFHHAFHVTPHQYLTEKRLSIARKLLANTDMPVSEVCTEVGFVSLGSFSSLFSRTVGLSPLAYRRASITRGR